MCEGKMKSALILLFILMSCSRGYKTVSWEKFYHTTYPRWIGAYSLSEISPYYKPGELITGPKETWQPLFAISLYAQTTDTQVKDCLYFYHTEQSLLKVIENVQTSCQQAALQEGIVTYVSKLSYKLMLQKLKISFFSDAQEIKLEYNLYNVQPDKDRNFQIFESNLGKKNESGLYLRSMVENQGSKQIQKLNLGDKCFELNPNCEVVQSQCHLCPSGFHQIIDSNCPQKGTRICGLKSCGQRGELACPRGRKFSGYTGDYCIPDSPLGICDKELRVHCMDKQLVCL
jgi:hypothetical protein